jgi:hypothetical protein
MPKQLIRFTFAITTGPYAGLTTGGWRLWVHGEDTYIADKAIGAFGRPRCMATPHGGWLPRRRRWPETHRRSRRARTGRSGSSIPSRSSMAAGAPSSWRQRADA